jgi:hypothetical protein
MALPCASRIGEAGLAEELEWSVADLRRCFAELASRSLVEADWKARVVYVPDAFRDNMPKSLTVAVAWRKSFNELPNCALKAKIYNRVSDILAGLSDAFLQEFIKDVDPSFVKSAWVNTADTADQFVTEPTAPPEIDDSNRALDADSNLTLDFGNNKAFDAGSNKASTEAEAEAEAEDSPQKPPGGSAITEAHFDEIRAGYPDDGRKRRSLAFRYFKSSVKTLQDLADCKAALSNYVAQRKRENLRRAERDRDPIPWMNDSTWFNNWRDWIPRRPAMVASDVVQDVCEYPSPDSDVCRIWDQMLDVIQEAVDVQHFRTWITAIAVIRLESRRLYLAVPNEMFRDWLSQNSLGVIEAAARPHGIEGAVLLVGRVRALAETTVAI